jgi:hypothetical protein
LRASDGSDHFKDGKAVLVADDSFAVDQAGSQRQRSDRHFDIRKSAGQVIAFPRDQTNASSIPARQDAEAIMLDLMNPLSRNNTMALDTIVAPRRWATQLQLPQAAPFCRPSARHD